MQAYFSHSYRDVPINTYFSKILTSAGVALRADKKTDVWCVAKLERYLFEMDGFVSIIPRRVSADGSIAYSAYIARELMLARRSRGPRVLFVDSQVLDQYRADFPPWAVPFFHEDPGIERKRHVAAIEAFRNTLTQQQGRMRRTYQARHATVVCGRDPMLRDAASHVAAILRDADYAAPVKTAASLDDAFDNIEVFESMLESELCVFVLGMDLAYSDLYLAMAHAHCIPSVRLRHDPDAASADPELSGVVRWTSSAEVKPQFLKLFENYVEVFKQPETKEDLQELATPELRGGAWDPNDGPKLLKHIRPDESYVSDRASSVLRGLDGVERSRTQSDLICSSLYDRIRRSGFFYTFEPVISTPGVQRIRPPQEIDTHKCGTCLDFACLFAALLEAAHEQPVVVVVDLRQGAHAVTGYFAPDAVTWDAPPQLGDIRGALRRGELILFETTGAVEARGRTVAAETLTERKEGGDTLDYGTAKNAATRLFAEPELRLRHFVDVRQLRQRQG